MAAPIAGVKYRIQNVDLQTYLEVMDSTTTMDIARNNVKLRPMKDTDRQYWTFESVSYYDANHFLVRSVENTNQCFTYVEPGSNETGTWMPAPDTLKAMANLANVTHLSDETYRLSFYDPFKHIDHYWYPDPVNTTIVILDQAKINLDSQKWKLIPVPPQFASVKNYSSKLENGVYRIRNLNGRSLLTCDENENDVYVKSQLDDESTYQRWNVIPRASGTYAIENAKRNLYLGCSNSIPSLGDALVVVKTAYEWDLQNIGGLAWSLCIPAKKLSIGFANYEVDDESEPSLVPSDVTPNQLWFIEKLMPISKVKVHALRQFPEGRYLLQSCHATQDDQTIYMNGVSSPYRIKPGTASTSQFELTYVDKKSARFTLTYVTKGKAVPFVTEVKSYITLAVDGTEFVLLKKAKGQYVICLPDSGHPRKVVSARLTVDIEDRQVFAVEDEISDELLQRWKFIPVK